MRVDTTMQSAAPCLHILIHPVERPYFSLSTQSAKGMEKTHCREVWDNNAEARHEEVMDVRSVPQSVVTEA